MKTNRKIKNKIKLTRFFLNIVLSKKQRLLIADSVFETMNRCENCLGETIQEKYDDANKMYRITYDKNLNYEDV